MYGFVKHAFHLLLQGPLGSSGAPGFPGSPGPKVGGGAISCSALPVPGTTLVIDLKEGPSRHIPRGTGIHIDTL